MVVEVDDVEVLTEGSVMLELSRRNRWYQSKPNKVVKDIFEACRKKFRVGDLEWVMV